MNKRNQLVISEQLSVNGMMTLLMKDNISNSDKQRIRTWLANFQKHMDTDKCNHEQGDYDGVYNVLYAFTDANPFWRLAKIQLWREKHPAFYTVGKGQGRRVACDDTSDEVMWAIIKKMYQIKKLFDKNHARFEIILAGEEDE